MNEYYKYYFNDENGILYKKYIGKITIEKITESWDIAIEQKIFEKPIKGIVLDYREATFDIELKDIHKIADYYKAHLEYFGGHKIAIVTESVKDVLVPTLVESKDDGYFSKPFFTMRAAEKWVLS